VNGKRVHDDPSGQAILERWIAAGHPLGNHTYSHVSLNDVAPNAYLADLEHGELILQKLLPGDPSWRFFRYPFLFEGNTLEKYDAVRRYLATHSYRIADVTIEAEDWLWNPVFARCSDQRNVGALAELRRGLVQAHVHELRYIRELTRLLTGRDIKHVLLLHIGAASADAVSVLLTAYEGEGVRWIDLPTALSDPFYAQAPRAAYPFGAALPYRVAKARAIERPPAPERTAQDALPSLCR
jgi:peptidoglycan-N-acetylglucosamine deacetylase